MASSLLRADVFVAQPIPAVPPAPIPNNITPLWSPTTATLISSAHEAVLVDPLFTTSQANSLADWIDDLFPDKRLTYIYVTHGHGDHFFGLSTLLQRFPNATAVAIPGVLAHMEEQLSPSSRDTWLSWFPGDQIVFPTSPPAQALDPRNMTINLEGHTLQAVPAGHSDTDDTSFLWVPDLRMAVTGDIVYNGVYSYLAESTTAPLRQRWIDAIYKIKALSPETVVVGHKLPGAVDGSWTLNATEDYIEMWGELAAEATDAEDMFEKVRSKDPDKTGDFVLWISCLQQFPSNSSAKA
ncbi:hypothetical protein MMC28_006707 [Mycoblastus sanguinarius]|nr:hypothetical protein [Mycoblastus sanguinarius]